MSDYASFIKDGLTKLSLPSEPKNLYDPLRYFLNIGGKRTRPTLLLMAHKTIDSNWQESINQALAIELFHNFTLIHDDIMDNAFVRRGVPTVHEKWNRDIAILSGDVLMVKAYQSLLKNAKSPIDFIELFNQTAIEVCDGQQMDMDFEDREDVTIPQYMEMIRLKTAVLLACALKIGALNGGADNHMAQHFYDFGIYLGLGFQLQDDYLDSFGDEASFGKQIGGDILNDKKTFLSIKLRDKIGLNAFNDLCGIDNEDEKISAVKSAYIGHGLDQAIIEEVNRYHEKSLSILNKIETNHPKDELLALSSKLMIRTN